MKNLMALFVLSFLPCLANASVIALDFTASGFSIANDGATPPQDPISGRITWQADSVTSGIQKLLSIDLVIDGFSYGLDDIYFDDYFGLVEFVHGKPSGGSVTGGTNDFWIGWATNPGILPPELFYPTYFTSATSGIYPLSFSYASENSRLTWEPQYLELSLNEISVPESSSIALMLIALFGLAIRRKV